MFHLERVVEGVNAHTLPRNEDKRSSKLLAVGYHLSLARLNSILEDVQSKSSDFRINVPNAIFTVLNMLVVIGVDRPNIGFGYCTMFSRYSSSRSWSADFHDGVTVNPGTEGPGLRQCIELATVLLHPAVAHSVSLSAVQVRKAIDEARPSAPDVVTRRHTCNFQLDRRLFHSSMEMGPHLNGVQVVQTIVYGDDLTPDNTKRPTPRPFPTRPKRIRRREKPLVQLPYAEWHMSHPKVLLLQYPQLRNRNKPTFGLISGTYLGAEQDRRVALARRRQGMLAQAFHRCMTGGQRFNVQNDCSRELFWGVDAVNEVNFWSRLSCKNEESVRFSILGCLELSHTGWPHCTEAWFFPTDLVPIFVRGVMWAVVWTLSFLCDILGSGHPQYRPRNTPRGHLDGFGCWSHLETQVVELGYGTSCETSGEQPDCPWERKNGWCLVTWLLTLTLLLRHERYPNPALSAIDHIAFPHLLSSIQTHTPSLIISPVTLHRHGSPPLIFATKTPLRALADKPRVPAPRAMYVLSPLRPRYIAHGLALISYLFEAVKTLYTRWSLRPRHALSLA
ncbi:hypothetical protein H4582DRAFT_2057483 [Lactarius indigo]|nr:hypothetical protein H4582DRAFT_2057483 [Lactarius indigo]